MRRLKRICIGLAVLALAISAYTTSAAPVISIDPADIEVSKGGNFTVNITVDPQGVEVMGVQYQLHFDNTLLNAVAQSKGTFLSHDGASAMNMVKKINNTIGVIEYGETRTMVDYGVTDPGVLASVTFNAIEPGVCDLTLKDVVMSDPDTDVEIPGVSINDGGCTIQSTGTVAPTHTATQTATEPPSTGMATPSATVALTATAVETAVTGQTPPTAEPQSTAIRSATTAPTMKRPSDKNMSGFTSAFAMIGLLIALYTISREKM